MQLYPAHRFSVFTIRALVYCPWKEENCFCVVYPWGLVLLSFIVTAREENSSDKIKTMLAFSRNENKNSVNIFASNGEKMLFLND
jgi:hypothetical protein